LGNFFPQHANKKTAARLSAVAAVQILDPLADAQQWELLEERRASDVLSTSHSMIPVYPKIGPSAVNARGICLFDVVTESPGFKQQQSVVFISAKRHFYVRKNFGFFK